MARGLKLFQVDATKRSYGYLSCRLISCFIQNISNVLDCKRQNLTNKKVLIKNLITKEYTIYTKNKQKGLLLRQKRTYDENLKTTEIVHVHNIRTQESSEIRNEETRLCWCNEHMFSASSHVEGMATLFFQTADSIYKVTMLPTWCMVAKLNFFSKCHVVFSYESPYRK